MRRGLVIACLGACACAPGRSEVSVVEPRLDTYVPDEAHEDEGITHTPPEPASETAPLRSRDEPDVRWSNERDNEVGCILEPRAPACGPLLPADAIREVVRGEVEAIRACWQDVEDVRTGLAFTIAADGSVTEVELDEGLPPEIDRCLRGVIGRLQFPTFEGGGSVTVRYP